MFSIPRIRLYLRYRPDLVSQYQLGRYCLNWTHRCRASDGKVLRTRITLYVENRDGEVIKEYTIKKGDKPWS